MSNTIQYKFNIVACNLRPVLQSAILNFLKLYSMTIFLLLDLRVRQIPSQNQIKNMTIPAESKCAEKR